jgi:hypothetical protein
MARKRSLFVVTSSKVTVKEEPSASSVTCNGILSLMLGVEEALEVEVQQAQFPQGDDMISMISMTFLTGALRTMSQAPSADEVDAALLMVPILSHMNITWLHPEG